MFHDDMPLDELADVAPLTNGGFCVICSCGYRGQRAVLKITRPRGPAGAAQDLLTEIDLYKRIAWRGGHANVARAFGSGFHIQQGERAPFLVLERLEGGTLEKAFENSVQLNNTWNNPVGRLPVALELADALVFLHHEAVPGGVIIHR